MCNDEISDQFNQPKDDDAVLGDKASVPIGDVVMGGLEGVKRRFVISRVPERIQALQEVLNYRAEGIDLAIAALNDESWDVQVAAYLLLRQRTEPEIAQALSERQYRVKVTSVDAQGQEIARQVQSARIFVEKLGEGVSLALTYIPGGRFSMGSPETEKGHYPFEGPQHLVNIAPFYIGIFPVTQAQWQAVAALPQVNHALFPEPWRRSYLNDADLPVVGVSWYEAVEFCARLTQKTGRNYRLLSEAEWEYACRAGTTTPFHFGQTITPLLANYNANRTYALGSKGKCRQQITRVNSFVFANAFGLYDLHGNVWEWCADPWHENYEGAPSDGTIWELGGDTRYRVLRGGAWNLHPKGCRSAYRDKHESDSGRADGLISFRVAVSQEYPLMFGR